LYHSCLRGVGCAHAAKKRFSAHNDTGLDKSRCAWSGMERMFRTSPSVKPTQSRWSVPPLRPTVADAVAFELAHATCRSVATGGTSGSGASAVVASASAPICATTKSNIAVLGPAHSGTSRTIAPHTLHPRTTPITAALAHHGTVATSSNRTYA
jgi:hypothetical protein